MGRITCRGDLSTRLMSKFRSGTNGLNEDLGVIHKQCKLELDVRIAQMVPRAEL